MYKPGDRVRVVELGDIHFNDYVIGDEAIVENVDDDGDLWVRWETNLSDAVDPGRCEMLHQFEVDLVEAAP